MNNKSRDSQAISEYLSKGNPNSNTKIAGQSHVNSNSHS
jgi:hypothetical protein